VNCPKLINRVARCRDQKFGDGTRRDTALLIEKRRIGVGMGIGLGCVFRLEVPTDALAALWLELNLTIVELLAWNFNFYYLLPGIFGKFKSFGDHVLQLAHFKFGRNTWRLSVSIFVSSGKTPQVHENENLCLSLEAFTLSSSHSRDLL
jgi:hypothetical protein